MYKNLSLLSGKSLSQLFDDEEIIIHSNDTSPQTPTSNPISTTSDSEISDISTSPVRNAEISIEKYSANAKLSKEIAAENRRKRAAKRKLQRSEKIAKRNEEEAWKPTEFFPMTYQEYKIRNELYNILKKEKPNFVQVYQLFRGFNVYDWSIIGTKKFDPAFDYWKVYRDDHDESYHYHRPSEAIIWRNKFYLYNWINKVPEHLHPLFQDDFEETFFKRYSLSLTKYH